jgi:hypothetical protein
MPRKRTKKPGHSFGREVSKPDNSSSDWTEDEPLAAVDSGSQSGREQMPKTGDPNRASVDHRGTTVHTTSTSPHAGETGAPVIPPDGETPAMGAPVRGDRPRPTDERDEKGERDDDRP